MGLFTRKKIDIPTGETKSVDALEIWEVRWKRAKGYYYSDWEWTTEAFFNEEDANSFKQSLLDAQKLLQNAHLINVSVKQKK